MHDFFTKVTIVTLLQKLYSVRSSAGSFARGPSWTARYQLQN